MEASHDGIVLIGGDGRIREANPKAALLLGRPASELLKSPLGDFLVDLGRLDASRILQVKREDGRRVEVEISTSRIPEEECVVVVLHDVTQLLSACQRAEAQCAVAGILAETAGDSDPMPRILEAIGRTFGWKTGGVWTPAADGLRCSAFWTSGSLDVSEFEAESRSRPCVAGQGLPGRVWTGVEPVYVPDVRIDPRCTRAAVAHRSGLRSAFAFPVIHEDRRIAVMEFFSDEARERDPELLSVCRSLGRQIGGFVESRRLRERLDYVALSSPAVLYSLDPETRTVDYISPNVRTEFGHDAAGFRKDPGLWSACLHPDDRDRVLAAFDALDREGEIAVEYRFRSGDGSWRWVHDECRLVRASHARVVGYWQDIAERRNTEGELERSRADLRQAQKMEAIGRLAGGIAHDFNNLLTVIQGYGELLFDSLAPEDSRRENVREIREAGRRAAALTRQLLAFSRKQVLQPRVLDVDETVRNLENMLRRLIGEDVRLETASEPGPHRIKADPGQIEQVILNLVVNARDAMPKGGRLEIATSTASLDGRPYVVLAVRDTGCGMSDGVKAHLFEPFFTTKEKGKGTGLGLSTVYGIVRQSDGQIDVASEEGRGTTFRMSFPAVLEEADPAGEAACIPGTARPGTVVLLIEDEPAVRDLASHILRKLGCRVLAAESGEAAVEIAKSERDIDLLLSDVVMPGMAGPEAMKRLREIPPRARVMYMSGYTESRISPEDIELEGAVLLMKPFTVQELAAKVAEVLA